MQYYALSQRSAAAQPLSDVDFVHALLGGGSAGGTGAAAGGHGQPRKQRNASSAGGHRGSSTARESSARENGAGYASSYASGSVSAREHAYKDMHAAYSKPRSAYAAHKPHSAGQRGVQAW